MILMEINFKPYKNIITNHVLIKNRIFVVLTNLMIIRFFLPSISRTEMCDDLVGFHGEGEL